MLVKLFFASDLHGSLEATEQTLALFEQSGADHLILLGDILNHGPRNPVPSSYNPPQVAEKLNQYANQIIAVRGNCDSEVDQMLLSFPMMMDYSWVLLESGARLFLTHGHLYNAKQQPALKAGDILAHGHSHVALAEQQGESVVFNPGSVTFPRENQPASYGLFENGTLSVISLQGELLHSCQIGG
ncbi:phosphodiesterase [Vibrio vulnificus]|nr:phosphodiesterase [Vibrio vulnificus]EHH1185541.1 phosphodiesterase [Vibrio vulnificus]EHH2479483.1 phosphodiesterase [Vibrio vulnificus]EHH2488874.1 phosphodiesterase [Vibrio vulnificus]